MEAMETIFKELFGVFSDMIGAFFAVLPKVLKFMVWVFLAIVILPCVFIAGNIYPWWTEWGEEF